jgi:hypothetical protein
MHPYQRRLIAEASKYGYEHPDIKPKLNGNPDVAMKNLTETDLISEGGVVKNESVEYLGEGITVMPGAEKAVMAAGADVPSYRKILKVLQNRIGGPHALVLDVTTPTGPGARRGNLTGEEAEVKIVKIADIGKFELRGYNLPSIKPGAKATRTWQDHKGDVTILAVNESVQEAYAPSWAFNQRKQYPILGKFKFNNNIFEYRAIVKGTPGSDWALSNGLTHEVFLRPIWNDYRDTRYAIIKKTVAMVAVDEAEGGKPVFEKWAITSHQTYTPEGVEAEGNDLAEGSVKDELDDFLHGLPNAAVTELKTLGDLKGKEAKIKAILMKHKANLILGTKSRKPSMTESIKVIVQWFQGWFEND